MLVLTVFSTWEEEITEAYLRMLFDLMDKNKDGSVNRREMIILLRNDERIRKVLQLPATFRTHKPTGAVTHRGWCPVANSPVSLRRRLEQAFPPEGQVQGRA